jgi:hypothetical protein
MAIRLPTAVAVSEDLFKKMSAMSSVVIHAVGTPVLFMVRSGSTSFQRRESMGVWPCFDATMIKVSFYRPFDLSFAMILPSDSSTKSMACSEPVDSEESLLHSTVFCATETDWKLTPISAGKPVIDPEELTGDLPSIPSSHVLT